MSGAEVRAGTSQVPDEIGNKCKDLFQDFLLEFKEDGIIKYAELAKELVSPERSILEVSFDDIDEYNQTLSTTIVEEFYRVYPYLCKAVSHFVKIVTGSDMKKYIECYVSFVDVPTRQRVRELNTAKLGTLIRISGQVIRTHPVHPELVYGNFVCMDCNTMVKDIEQEFKFTNPTICSNPVCSNKRRFMLDVDTSLFIDFQKVRVQETQIELPRGCIPRALEVILRAENVEAVQAGDKYDFTGTLVVVPDVGALSVSNTKTEISSRSKPNEQGEGVTGLKSLGVRDLGYKIAFLACGVTATSWRFGGTDVSMEDMTQEMMKRNMTEAEWNRIYEMSRDKDLYRNIAHSLFPAIHGNEEIKKGLTLMLFGGVPKTTEEGTSLRGDINCCIVGDPSTAKSQFLKTIAEISPRSVYTSGKASTAAGLTAAVVRDEESSDFVIEAGALMLADHGICCIDEFDKMDPQDQVAIHEAMEQQTISIAKAGVRATLNARTSILAAANPVGGRYDRKKSLQLNIQMSAPIMSRFDLFFVIVDECNEIVDNAVAQRILDLHCDNWQNLEVVYTVPDIVRYINFAKHFKPVMSEKANEMLVSMYTRMRQRMNCEGKWRVTVRQLESLIRLSEALAKLECVDEVKAKHVSEAMRLLNKSIVTVEQPDIEFDGFEDLDSDSVDLDETPPLVPYDPNNPDEEISQMDQTNHEPRPSTSTQSEEIETEDQDDSQKKRLTMSYREYKNVSNMLVIHMRNEESRAESEGEERSGIRRSELVAWYLDVIQDALCSEAELLERKNFIEKIIDRLIYHDLVIIPLTTAELKSSGEKSSEEEEKDPLLVVHPNYFVDV